MDRQKQRDFSELGFLRGITGMVAVRTPEKYADRYRWGYDVGSAIGDGRRWLESVAKVHRDMAILDDILPQVRREPCATCLWAALCKERELVCDAFRAYCGEGLRDNPPRVPDKHWSEAWEQDKK